MNDLETQLHDSLHALGDHGRSLSGPALRRTARRRTVRARTGGFAVVGAAAVAGVVIAPGLLDTPATRVAGATGQSSAPASKTLPAATPATPANVKPTGSAAAPAPSSTATALVQAYQWDPAGSLIDDATVLATAPKVAASDSDWTSWTKDYDEGPLLVQDSVEVVFAGVANIYNSGTDGPRPLVVVTGRSAAQGPLQIAVLTSVAGGVDAMKLNALTVEAMHPAPTSGPQAIAVYNGLTMYVAAEHGVDSATYTYTDDTGTHTAPMTVTNGVAIAPEPVAALKASNNGAITNIRATSHGTVVWDAAPVAGR
ncbi:hypothetical protein acdb102_33440 [Acidothermaceae bacterium B102]|nr:hypothetical protein acdb102_33440 [Acidothermaceae bacterium B102]